MMQNAQRITRALKGHWYGSYGTALCPAHKDTRPSLSLANGADGRLLARCHAGCAFTNILDALKCLGLAEGAAGYSLPSRDEAERNKRAETAHAEKQEAHALKCWREAVPIGGTIAETYLRHRGITCDLPDTLRFHSECWHPTGGRFPAMVALVEGAARAAVHRTYLRPDGTGKAAVEPAKAMLGAVAGGGVILSTSGQALVVCEGIETGLSLASGLLTRPATIWAALSTSGVRRLSLPAIPSRARNGLKSKLTIATDGDSPGRDAGNELATRATAAGWKVSLLPAPDGRDWNDLLLARRLAA
jgi:hypothetical protein